tara:strand:+ start:938 stop:1552 length:615 start_codon:yes stop_codon:yes gene_type:complete
MSYDYKFKSIIIGDSCVGKTSIVTRLLTNEYRHNSMVTIGVDFFTKVFDINDKKIKLQLWDTAGQEIFRSITLSYFRNACISFVVFDFSNKQSFNNCEYWIEVIKNNTQVDGLICLIGNKSDLKQHSKIKEKHIMDLIKKYGILYHEVSAKDNIGIYQTFKTVLTEYYCRMLSGKYDNYYNGGVFLGDPGNSNNQNYLCKSGCC